MAIARTDLPRHGKLHVQMLLATRRHHDTLLAIQKAIDKERRPGQKVLLTDLEEKWGKLRLSCIDVIGEFGEEVKRTGGK